MRIFLTGATGYIGSAVLKALVDGGHEVTALVRSSEKGQRVAARGGAPVVGHLAEPASYRARAAGHDGYIHAASDTSDQRVDLDRATIDVIASMARERHACFIYTSGVWVLGNTSRPSGEDAPLQPVELVTWRPAHEQRVLATAVYGVRPIVVRPGIVYGGARGIIGDLFREATAGAVRVVGNGKNRWALVYDRDLGALYAQLATHTDASGIVHANDEGDEQVGDIVQAIAATLPSRPGIEFVPLNDARATLGSYADALALDQVVRSPRARAIGWAPSLRSIAAHAARLYDEWKADGA